MMQAIFWASLGWLAYVYAGYPLLAWLLAKLAGRRVNRSPGHCPSVTILTAAHNEAAHIGATVQNKLDLDYPAGKLELIVVSDGSVDGTDEIVRGFGGRVTLLRQEPRAGKTSALNMAIAHAHGELLVFSDANSIYDREALQQIVANFADPSVGYVTGKMVYANPDGSLVGDGCSAYMRYENFLRGAESGFGSVIGVDGGIDAVRRSLYRPMRADQLPDFVLPLQVAEAGHRVVFEPKALLREPALSGHRDEYRMRVRVGLRALWALWDRKSVLNPLRAPVLAWQVFSHKVLRYLAFLPLAALLVASVLLAEPGTVFAWVLGVQVIAYALALAGWLTSGRGGGAVVGFPFYFTMLNVACAHAALKFLSGKKQVVWTPRTG
jgi:cellulose synthase/poly-beta-1,6-N-acetylglucosamine synthase-like glycosyltransferase